MFYILYKSSLFLVVNLNNNNEAKVIFSLCLKDQRYPKT